MLNTLNLRILFTAVPLLFSAGCVDPGYIKFEEVLIADDTIAANNLDRARSVAESAIAAGIYEQIFSKFPEASEQQQANLEIGPVVLGGRKVSVRCTLKTDERLETATEIVRFCRDLPEIELSKQMGRTG